MKALTLIFLLSFCSSIFAKDCEYKLNASDLKITWTAYKTPLKAPVSGSFDKLGVDANHKGNSLSNLLSGIPFNITTASVNTKNPDRDKKLAKFFFAPLGTHISGKTLSYSKKVLKVAITMNSKTVITPMKVETTENGFVAMGVIDVLDFNGLAALKGINAACKELHEGKTWNDVALKLEGKFSKQCK